MAGAGDPLEGVKTWWRGLSPRNKWIIGGGAGLVLLFAIGEAGSGGRSGDVANNYGYGPYRQGYQGQDDQDQGDRGQTYQGQGQGQGDQGQGYANQGYPTQGGAAYGQPGGGQTEGDDPTGYWGRQRAQDQESQAFSGYIRDTNTVRDNETGEVHSDVPNAYADPAIESGAYSQVPTSELPTTTPAPVEAAPAPSE
jgi:hypothetical protein